MPKEERMVSLKEFRAYENEEGELRLSGYASVFEQPTILYVDRDGNEYKEVIDRHAFDKTDMSKCCLKYNHESSFPVLSRVRGKFMELKVDDYGLYFDAKLFGTQSSRDIYEIVKEGGLDECSFAFTIAKDGDEYDKKTRTRRINNIGMLWDCAIVDNPAYGGTSVTARSFFEAEAEKENLDRLKRKIAKEKALALAESIF